MRFYKDAWQKVGSYSDLRAGWEDHDFWCKFVEAKLFCIFAPDILCRYRVRGTSMLRSQTNPQIKPLIADMKSRHPWLELVAPD